MNKRMDSRLLALKKEMERSTIIRRRSDKLREQEKSLVDQPTGRSQQSDKGREASYGRKVTNMQKEMDKQILDFQQTGNK